MDECSRRRVRRPSIATYLSSIGVFHWQHLGRTAGCEVPRGLPPLEIAYEGDGQALCSQGNGVQRSRCGRLPNLQRAQRNFDVCDDRRSADIHVSLRGSAPSFLQGSHFDSKQVKTVIRHNSQEREGQRSTRWHEVAGSARPGASGSRNGYIMQVVANPRGGFM